MKLFLFSRRLAASLLLPALAVLPLAPPSAALAAERTTAQTIGISDASSSLVPGFVWGGNRRCDPTDFACTQGGRLDVVAQDTQPVPAKPFAASERVLLDLSLQGQPIGVIELGLWRDQAPVSVDTFVRLAAGVLMVELGDAPASYDRSSAVRIAKDREIVLGALRQVRSRSRLSTSACPPAAAATYCCTPHI